MGSAMSTGHLHVHLGDGTAERHVSVLLVHVDDDGSGQVANNQAVGSDAGSLLLENLHNERLETSEEPLTSLVLTISP